MSASGPGSLVPTDLALSNLVVSGNAVSANVTAANLNIDHLSLHNHPIDIIPAASFVLTENFSMNSSNIITICFNGTLTGDITTPLAIASFDPNLGPPNSLIIASGVVPTFGIFVSELSPDGTIKICVSGAAFPPGSFNVMFLATYLLM